MFLLVGCDSGVVKILQGDLVQVSAITVSHSRYTNATLLILRVKIEILSGRC